MIRTMQFAAVSRFTLKPSSLSREATHSGANLSFG